MKLHLSVALFIAVCRGQAAGPQSELATGRAFYAEGEFKKAAVHFQLAVKSNPNDGEAFYWMGMSYQALAAIAIPFGGRYSSKAGTYLNRAVELAPSRQDYRRELFDFLLDSAWNSRTALPQAGAVLRTVSEADPDYSYMRRRLQYETRENASAGARLGRVFLAAPRAAVRLSELPAAALSSPTSSNH